VDFAAGQAFELLTTSHSEKSLLEVYVHCAGFPHIFKNHLILFQYLFNTKFDKFNTITSLHFSKFLIMKRNFIHYTALQKQWSASPSVKFRSDTSDFFSIYNFHTFSIPDVHFGKIQYFFKVLTTNFEIQYSFNIFNTAWEPWLRGNRTKMKESSQGLWSSELATKSSAAFTQRTSHKFSMSLLLVSYTRQGNSPKQCRHL